MDVTNLTTAVHNLLGTILGNYANLAMVGVGAIVSVMFATNLLRARADVKRWEGRR